jgi:hypothetical protein
MISDMPAPAAVPVTGIPLETPTVGEGFDAVRLTEPTGRVTVEPMLVELAKLAGNDWPLTSTAPPGTNPVPVMVIEVAFPASMLDGVTEVTTGAGFRSMNCETLETPAEGEGF